MSKKNKIQVNIVHWSSYELDGKLDEIILKLQDLKKANPSYFDFQMSVESESGYYGSCSTNIDIHAFRWETDDEFEARKIAEKNAAEAKKLQVERQAKSNEQRERSLYESLKKKFEKEINEG